jgi:hypothetical protein
MRGLGDGNPQRKNNRFYGDCKFLGNFRFYRLNEGLKTPPEVRCL